MLQHFSTFAAPIRGSRIRIRRAGAPPAAASWLGWLRAELRETCLPRVHGRWLFSLSLKTALPVTNVTWRDLRSVEDINPSPHPLIILALPTHQARSLIRTSLPWRAQRCGLLLRSRWALSSLYTPFDSRVSPGDTLRRRSRWHIDADPPCSRARWISETSGARSAAAAMLWSIASATWCLRERPPSWISLDHDFPQQVIAEEHDLNTQKPTA